jgi:pantothenate kinase
VTPPRIAQLAAMLPEIVGPGRFLLGITGPPGSGKSTLARQLADQVNASERQALAAVIPMDGFHLTNDQLHRLGWMHRKGAPHTFDATRYVSLVERLRHADRTIRAPRYDRTLHEPVADAITIEPTIRLVITEGNYLLSPQMPWRRLIRMLDQTWYLDTPLDECMQRLKRRHIAGGSTELQARQRLIDNDLPNAHRVIACRDRGDRIITADLMVADLAGEVPKLP